MSIIIENEIDKPFEFDYEELITKVVNKCIEYIECPYETAVSVTIVDSDSIRAINKEFRQIDNATDVLSFPMISYDKPCNFDNACEDDMDCFDPETNELLLGDIVLCYDKIYEQAKEYGHTPMREMAFLTAHSMFHLFGYDHMNDEERVVMEKKQEDVLNQLGITRE